MHPASPRARAFTLIELLTVIAIIGVLAAIVIPVVGKVRTSAKSAQNLSQLRNLATAALTFANDNKGRLPGVGLNPDTRWPVLLCPYMGVPNVLPINAKSLAIFHCTLTPFEDYQTTDGRGNYNGAYGYNRELRPQTPASLVGHAFSKVQIPARTIVFGDKIWNWKDVQGGAASQDLWPEEYPVNANGLAANWSGKFHASYLDGHAAVLPAFPGRNAFLPIPLVTP
jgi:prepilin-type N-terminal cleavage/methylation domain-containing protein